MAINPPTNTATRTGHPCATASCAAATAPMPAKEAWQSQIIPPSPVTRVMESKMMPKQTPCPIRPIQKLLTTRGSTHRMANARRGSCQPKADP